MKNIILLFVSLVILLGCKKELRPAADGMAIPAGYQHNSSSPTFKVLSWNVEHFVDNHDNPYIRNKREDQAQARMKPRISPFLQALRLADADIVVLQEFESAAFLQQLADDSLGNMGYRYFADAPSHTWYMNVVVMSRFPMGVLSSYGNVTTPAIGYVNEEGKTETQNRINTRMWSVDIYPAPEYNFTLTGLHLKAGRGERNIAVRKGQIMFLKNQFDRFLREDPEKNILVAGDLNATPESEEIRLLLKRGRSGNAFKDPVPFYVLSHPADSATRRLDYALPNMNMYKELASAEVKLFFSPGKMRVISDHLPVLTTFYKSDR